MPITETIYKVLYEDEKVENVIKQIMLREFKSEQEF
jgi:glycerol-3-phosphate dehydrogenase (NAD(P)+)